MKLASGQTITIEFDLERAPPSLEEIAAEKSRLDVELRKIRRKASISVTFLAFLYIAIAFYLCNTTASTVSGNPVVLFAFIGFLFIIFSIVFIATWHGERSARICREIESMSGLDEEPHQHRCPRILYICRTDPVCRTYRDGVVAQGRNLSVAEAELIEYRMAEMAEQLSMKDMKQHNQLACSILHNPEPLEV